MFQRQALFITITVFCIFVACPLPTFAQSSESAYDLGEVIVSATKTEQYQSQVGSSTSVITRETIERSGKRRVSDVLVDVPGLSVTQSGAMGGAVSVDIRGAKQGQTLIMIDGVEVYDPIGVTRNFDFSQLSTDNVERIEIVRGPQSPLYGSDAMAGVINIVTRKGSGPVRASYDLEAGSFRTFREAVGVGGQAGRSSFTAQVSRLDSDGISQSRDGGADAYRNTSVSGRYDFSLSDTAALFLTTRYIDSESEVDDGAYEDDPNRTNTYEQFVGRVGLSQQLAERWSHELSVSGNVLDRTDRDPADAVDTLEDETSRFRGDHKKIEWQHNVTLFDADVQTLGVDFEEDRGASYSQGQFFWSNTQSDRQTQQSRAGYGQSYWRLLDDRAIMTAGMRVDDYDRFGTQPTGKLSAAYAFPETSTRLKANYGTAFRAPNLYQLYDANYGNAALQPEESVGADIGVRQSWEKYRTFVDVAYFHNTYENLIDSDPVTFQFKNIKEASGRGYEWEAGFAPGERLELGATYTYTKTQDKDTGQPLGRRPKNQASAYADWRIASRTKVRVSGRYVGENLDAPAYNTNVNKKYAVMDISARYDLSEKVELFGRIDNIFDREYEPIRGYSGMPRGIYAGVRGEF